MKFVQTKDDVASLLRQMRATMNAIRDPRMLKRGKRPTGRRFDVELYRNLEQELFNRKPGSLVAFAKDSDPYHGR